MMSTSEILKIGITMRIVPENNCVEERDALAEDWSIFMARFFPGIGWLPIPNLSEAVVDFIDHWGVNGLIFSGGDDLGKTPRRDLTETSLISMAANRGYPVFGVCWGLQFIQNYFGGECALCPSEEISKVSHAVEFVTSPDLIELSGQMVLVNSFYNYGIPCDALASQLEPLAVMQGKWVEAAKHRQLPITGVMWHPERKIFDKGASGIMMRHAFNLDVLG